MTCTLDRFWSKVTRTDGCWTWNATTLRGYGVFCLGRRRIAAHRFAYAQVKGPIPAGYVIDHRCCNTRCVNPDHLEAISQRTNVLRGRSSARKPDLLVCGAGHKMTRKNTYTRRTGARECKECRRAQNRAAWARKRDGTTGTPNHKKTHCPQGHPYSPANTYTPPSKPSARICRICRRNHVTQFFRRQDIEAGRGATAEGDVRVPAVGGPPHVGQGLDDKRQGGAPAAEQAGPVLAASQAQTHVRSDGLREGPN